MEPNNNKATEPKSNNKSADNESLPLPLLSSSSSAYVMYGVLDRKKQEYVDWIRIEVDQLQQQQQQNSSNDLDGGGNKEGDFREMDERAFEIFRRAAADDNNNNNNNDDSNNNNDKSSSLITTMERLKSFSSSIATAASTTTKTIAGSSSNNNISPQSVSYAVFDANWVPLRFSPRHTNVDVAILLHAAAEEQKKEARQQQQHQNDDSNNSRGRTCLRSSAIMADNPRKTHSELIRTKVEAGTLPVVPIRRSSQKQYLVKQSVNMFFNKQSVPFFACFPLRNSPRTIYRFEIVVEKQKGKGIAAAAAAEASSSNNGSNNENENENGNNIEKMNNKLNQMRMRMSSNATDIRRNLASKASTTKSSFLNRLTTTSSSSIKEEEEEETINFKAEEEDASSSTITEAAAAATANTLPNPSPSPKSREPVGYVALSIDDAPCRFDDRSHSKMADVLDLLQRYDAKATFMVISSFIKASSPSCHEPDMIRLLQDGHELANHGVRDEAMDKMATSVDVFLEALDECNNTITALQRKANNGNDNGTVTVGVKWFRAPQSRYTKIMEEGLIRRNMYNVMCDAYAACPVVEDGPWIASSLSKQIRNGSIALIHMPENCGFRDYCFTALEQLLEDLCVRRNFKVVTVSELQRISEESKKKKKDKVEL